VKESMLIIGRDTLADLPWKGNPGCHDWTAWVLRETFLLYRLFDDTFGPIEVTSPRNGAELEFGIVFRSWQILENYESNMIDGFSQNVDLIKIRNADKIVCNAGIEELESRAVMDKDIINH
jgi:hypothetical protein